MKFAFLLLACLIATAGFAQTTDNTEEVDPNDRTRNEMFNRQNPSAALQAGSAFYVSNPSPLVELDTEKAYFRQEWEELIIRTHDGKTATLQGRYRIVDQKFEIQREDGIYELYNTVIKEAQLGDAYFVLLPTGAGIEVYEVHYRNDRDYVLTHHSTDWIEPKKHSMFDTSESKRTLKRKVEVFLMMAHGKFPVENKRTVVAVLGIGKSDPAMQYIKDEKLNMKDPNDIAKFLQYRTEQGV